MRVPRLSAPACILGMFLVGLNAPVMAQPTPGADAVAELVRMLQSERPPHQSVEAWNALRTIAFLGLAENPESAQAAVPLLRAAVRDDDPEVAITAAASLLSIAPDEGVDEASGVLRAGLQSSDPEVRRAVTDALHNMTRITAPLTPLFAAALDVETVGQWALAETLRRLPAERAGEVVVALAGTLASADPRARHTAARTLAGYGPHAAAATTALQRLLESEDALDRVIAATTLAAVHRPPDPSLLRVLADAFRAPDVDTRSEAVRAVEKWGPAAVALVPALAASLRDDDSAVVWAAAHQLGLLGPAAVAALPALRAASASDATGNARTEALIAIRLIENKVEIDWSKIQPREVLMAALASADAAERLEGVKQLHRMGVDATWALPRARAALTDRDTAVRYYAAYGVAALDPASGTALIPTFREMLHSRVAVNGSNPKILASLALSDLGRPGADVLTDALSAEDADTRVEALMGLRSTDEWPPSTVEALLRALSDSDERVHTTARVVLMSKGGAPERMIPILLRQLTSASPAARLEAVNALPLYKGAADAAIEPLRTSMRDADPAVAAAAADALISIDPRRAADLLPSAVAEFSAAARAAGVAPPTDAVLEALENSAERLGRFGVVAREALPALLDTLTKTVGSTQVVIGVAAIRVDPEGGKPVMDAFIRALDNEETRRDVLWGLEQLGPLAASAEAAVARIEAQNVTGWRYTATRTLKAIRR